jgi:hypothetical protein
VSFDIPESAIPVHTCAFVLTAIVTEVSLLVLTTPLNSVPSCPTATHLIRGSVDELFLT